jgi:peptide/nickel transport system substrate-binding protein
MLMRALLLLPLLLAACKPAPIQHNYAPTGQVSGTQADVGDRLNLAMLGNPPSLVPYLAAENNASTIAGSIYHALLTYDANLNLVPQLAETYSVSTDNRTLTFTLKPGLTFADGTPLTSADVSATFHALTNPTTRTPYADDYMRVQKFETPDPRTIRVTYAEPFAPALSSWAGLIVLPAKIIAQTNVSGSTFNDTPLKTKPLGSGPYQLLQWKQGESFLLGINAKSFEKPFISQLYYRILPDQSTQWLEMKAGNLDMLELSPLAYTRLIHKPWFTNNYATYRYLGSAYTYVGFNLKDPLFTSRKTRQALSYAVDRQGIINAVLFGQGEPLASIFKPGTWAYNTHLQPYPYNPQKARQLLAEDGWKPGPNGILMKNGTPFRFTLTTNQGNESRLKTAQILQKFLADVGVQMDIRVQEWSTFLTNTIKPRKFQAIIMGWTLPVEPDPYDVWHSSKTGPDEFNMISYNNPEVDKAIVASRGTLNQAERKVHLDRVQEILAEDQPYLWLYAPYALEAVHKRVQGIIPAPAGIGYNSVDWFVPKPWHLRPQLVP